MVIRSPVAGDYLDAVGHQIRESNNCANRLLSQHSSKKLQTGADNGILSSKKLNSAQPHMKQNLLGKHMRNH